MRNRSHVQPKPVTPSLPSPPSCAQNAWPRATRSVQAEGRQGQRGWGPASPPPPRLHPDEGKPALGRVPTKPSGKQGKIMNHDVTKIY
jgi:hypothetical protein